MDQFIEYLVKNLVDHPDDVKVRCTEGNRGIIVEIRVAEADIGKVVGRQGRTIGALRTIASTISARMGRSLRLELLH